MSLSLNRNAFALCRRVYDRLRIERCHLRISGYSRWYSTDDEGFSRSFRNLKEDLKDPFRLKEQFPSHCDVLVIGGGIMGSSIAYWLKQRTADGLKVVVVERDPTYTRCSTTLAVGGIRQQFSLEENIRLSMYSAEFLRNIRRHMSVLDQDPPDIQFQPHGYLFLASDIGAEQLEENHKVQLDLGAKVDLLSPTQLKKRFPWLNTDGVAIAAHGLENEGWFDPWALLCTFKNKAISLGTIYLGAEVTKFNFIENHGVVLQGTDEYYQSANHCVVKMPDGKEREIQFAIAIVAAGYQSGEVAKMLRIGTGPGILETPMPVEPRKRYVYVFHCENGPGLDCPLLIDNSGAYVRREGLGGLYVAGKSPEEGNEPDNSNLDVDYTYFDNCVWPLLANRIPAFEAIKIRSAWAGYYDYNSLDQNALIGRHPYYSNVFFATGFSGHGIQMAPGIGRAIMELILDRGFRTIDLTRFSPSRVISKEPIYERNIV